MVASREIGATDRTTKQHIADESKPGVGLVNDNVTGRVTGAMQYAKLDARKFQRVPVVQVPVGCHGPGTSDSILRPLFLDTIQQPLIVFVRTDHRHTHSFSDFRSGASMIEVAVCQPHRDYVYVELRSYGQQPIGFTARIDEHALL